MRTRACVLVEPRASSCHAEHSPCWHAVWHRGRHRAGNSLLSWWRQAVQGELHASELLRVLFRWSHPVEAALSVQVEGEAVGWRKAAGGKIDSAEVHRLLAEKASVAHVKEALTQKADQRVVRLLQDAQEEGAAAADRLTVVENELHRKAAMQVRTSCCVLWCQGHVRAAAYCWGRGADAAVPSRVMEVTALGGGFVLRVEPL